MGSADRRVYARVPASFKVDYIHGDEYIISFNKDISVDGMYIFTKNPPPPGSHLKLVFTVGLEEVELSAIVAWINLVEAEEDHGMGVQFLDPPSPVVKKQIVRHIHRIKILQSDGKQA